MSQAMARISTPKSQKRKKDAAESSQGRSSKKQRREPDAKAATTSSPSKSQRHSTHSKNKTQPRPRDANAQSPFVSQTTSFYLALSPIANDFALQGLCAEHISPLLLTYYPPLNGVLLSYSNPRLSDTATPDGGTYDTDTTVSRANDEYGVTLIWLTIDCLVLRPSPDTLVQGHVRLQNENYLGLVCYNFFNAVIERRRLPSDWKWVAGGEGVKAKRKTQLQRVDVESEQTSDSEVSAEDEVEDAAHLGHFVNGKGRKIDEVLSFKVRNYECAPSSDRERGFISLEGSLLDDRADRVVDDRIRSEFKETVRSKRSARI